ncbi:MAG: TVP38/TMEM64 family protein [Corynebacterium urealyticum]|uniref:TVP38/TMEM64 family membrane protein n=1 Tax=Corynebacterium urealyticum TaxID=43771 RepID=A0A2W5BE04_9CORY|nr:MAG: TVP38/TMEM64 family protein [Corynebacterium urealyticum]
MLTHLRERWAQLGTWAQIGLILASLATVACLFFIPLPSPHTIRDWVGSTGPWAPLAYLVLMVLCTQFPFPRTVWTLTAGLMFNPLLGITLMFLGLALSATISVLIFRRVGGRWRPAEDGDDPRVGTLRELIEQRGWLAVLGLRLVPAVPFSLLNYACGLVRIPLPGFLFATVVGSAPNTVGLIIATNSLTSQHLDSGTRMLWLVASALLMLAGLAIASREAWLWRKLVGSRP